MKTSIETRPKKSKWVFSRDPPICQKPQWEAARQKAIDEHRRPAFVFPSSSNGHSFKGLSKFQTRFPLHLLSSPALRLLLEAEWIYTLPVVAQCWLWKCTPQDASILHWSLCQIPAHLRVPGMRPVHFFFKPSRDFSASKSSLLYPVHRWFCTLFPVWAHGPLSWEKRPFLPCDYLRAQQTTTDRATLSEYPPVWLCGPRDKNGLYQLTLYLFLFKVFGGSTFWDLVSFCSRGWPRTPHVAQVGLKLMNLPPQS